MASNEVRIIGGKWRGRKLVFPDARDLRPTLGRVRETLFNWLRVEVADSRCLDLFAGSGALGFEALSRGAAEVTFVDSHRPAVQCLTANLVRLGGADRGTVVLSRAERLLARGGGPWDLIFLDPPFRYAGVEDLLGTIAEAGALAPAGLIYLEVPRRQPFPTGPWRQHRHGEAGDTQFGLLASP